MAWLRVRRGGIAIEQHYLDFTFPLRLQLDKRSDLAANQLNHPAASAMALTLMDVPLDFNGVEPL